MLPQSELQHTAASLEVPSLRASSEWLDKRCWLCHVALCLIPFAMALPLWIFHLSVDPIWYFSGAVESVGPGIVPGGLPFADPNLGWLTQALGHLAAWQWIHGQVPWWNPYSGIGLPLAGGMQPGAFFLPFVLLLLLHNGFLWLRIAMQVVAGISTFALLRELKLGHLASLMGGVLFELNGTFAFTPGPASVFCAAAFLPLLLLGIEQAAGRERERTGIVWIALALAFSLLAGFPEVAYINGLLALVWSIGRFATLRRRWRFAMRVAWGGVLGLLLSAPLLVAFWSLLMQSSAFKDHLAGLASLPLTAVPSVFVPYILGPYPGTFSSPWTANVWGTSGYVGILLFFFSILGLSAKKPLWLRILLMAWVAVCAAKVFGLQPFVGAINHIPFLLQTSFPRYSPPSWTLCLIILAAFALDELRRRQLRLRIAALLALATFVLSICIAWPWRSIWDSPPAQAGLRSEYLVCSAGWALGSLISAAAILQFWRGGKGRIALAGLLALNFAVFFSIPVLSACRPGSVDRSAMRFLQSHLGLSRFYTLGPVQPNYGAYFHVASINYVALPVPSLLSRYMAQHLFPRLSKLAGTLLFAGGPWFAPGSGLTYLNEFLPEYEKLGTKYVVADAKGMDTLSPQVEIPTAPQGNEPLPLQPGQRVQVTIAIPPAPAAAKSSIRGISALLGTYGNTANGDLTVDVCAEQTCLHGTRSLSESADNDLFYVPLSGALPVKSGTPGVVTITHAGGSKPVALWIWPDSPNQVQHLVGPDSKLMPGKGLHMSLAYDSPTSALPRVYHDSVMDIFELPHPAPYYRVDRGGPCRLDSTDRESVHAVCDAPSVLVRHELYMPGWHALLRGRQVGAKPYRDLFQSFDLPQGDSHLLFSYAPPGATPAALAALFALVALAAELGFGLKRK